MNMNTDSSPPDELLERTLDRFWETVPPLWGQIRAHIRSFATQNFDISVEQFHILRFIRRGNWSVSELAEAKGISRPAISQGVDALVNKGLISRSQNLQDRRYVQLELTSAGNDLLDTVFQHTRAWMKSKLASCAASEIEDAVRGMEALKKMFNEAYP
jgi:DNA-binding MarR family transcriptional regulator